MMEAKKLISTFSARGLGSALLLMLFSLAALSVATLIAGGVIGRWMLYLSTALAVAYLVEKRQWLSVAAFIAISAASVGISLITLDWSTDGWLYHHPTIEALAGGWNPYHDPGAPYNLWTRHYAKAIEIIEACVVAALGDIETAKIINLLFITALGLLGWDELRREGMSRPAAAGGVAVLLCSPVMFAQALTTYVDLYLYIYLCLTLIAILRINRGEGWRQWCLLMVVTMLAVGTKFTIFFYQGLALIAWMAFEAARRRWKLAGCIAVFGIAALLLAPLLFYHPYVTNWLGWGHPLYPLVGKEGLDIMICHTPACYLGLNRVAAFLLSLIRPWANPLSWRNHIDHSEGFGPWFIVILAIGVVYLIAKRPRTPKAIACCYVIACAIAASLIFEQSWWARYISFAWIAAVAVYILLPSGWWHRIVVALAILTAAQSAYCVSKFFVNRFNGYDVGKNIHYDEDTDPRFIIEEGPAER